MKNLSEYIKESFDNIEEIVEASIPESKTFTFDFTDLENAEETINSLKDNDAIEVDDNIVKLTVKKDDKNVERAMEVLRQYTEIIRSSSKRASDEQYAQKTVKFAKVVADVDDFIDKLDSQEGEAEDQKQKEEE